MENLKLIQILKILSLSELKEFEKFVRSPFFNESGKLMKLFSILRKFYPKFNSSKLNREFIFMELYPEEKYNDKKLRNGFSALFKLAEEYLSYREYKKNPFAVKKSLLKAFDNSKLDKFFENYLNIAEVEISGNKRGIEEFFLQNKELIDIKIGFNLRHDKQILIGEEVIRRGEYGAFHFILHLMRGYRGMIANKYSYKVEFNGSIADEFFKCVDIEKFINYLKKNGNSYYPIIAVNYYILRAMADYEEETHFSKFHKLFNEFIDTFSKEEQFYIYKGYESYLIITHHIRSALESEKLSFSMYKQMLAKKLYVNEEDGFMSISLFSNIFTVALLLKEYKWLDEFLRDYKDKLRPEIKTDMLYICTAKIEFAKGNFEKALENIMKVKFEHYRSKLEVKNLMFKIYYELNSFEQVYSLIDTTKHFLSKNKFMSDAPIERNLNFVKFIEILARIKNIPDPARLELLKREISETNNVSGKNWLLEKAEELAKAQNIKA